MPDDQSPNALLDDSVELETAAALPAIPLPEAVVLPGMIAPLHLETWAYVRAVEVAMLADKRIFLVPRRSHEEGTSPE